MVSQSEWVTRPIDAFKVSSPWSEDRLPTRPDTSQAVLCGECGRRFLSQEWLDKHIDEGHLPDGPVSDIESELRASKSGSKPSPFQLIARDLLARIDSGDLKPGSEITTKELMARHNSGTYSVNRALRLLAEQGVITRCGFGQWTQYQVAGDSDES